MSTGIIAIVSIVIWIAVSRELEKSSRDEQRENNHFNVCWFLINIDNYHFAFSEYPILKKYSMKQMNA